MHVYLAGPIGGLSYEDAVGWRRGIEHELSLQGIRSFSPMRFKTFLSGENGETIVPARADNLPPSTWTNPKALTTRDLGDIRRSDIVLAYMPEMDRERTGTILEIGYAFHAHIPCVLASSDKEFINHPMVQEMVMAIVPTVGEARIVVEEYLLDDNEGFGGLDDLLPSWQVKGI